MSAQDYFKGKRIAVVGLGPQGNMVEDVKFLIKSGALVSVYDLKSEARLKSHLVLLRSLGLANHVCGSIPAEDLTDMDLIILSHEYPRESSFLKAVDEKNRRIELDKAKVTENKEKPIPIEYPETLFFRRSPPVTVIGVMGQCGKSTIVSMLSPMLETVCSKTDNQGFFVIDPESDKGIVSNLRKVKSGDIVIMRLIGQTMKELHNIRISPQVAVFASEPAKEAYHDSPFEILDFQTYNNFIVASDGVIDAIRSQKVQPKAKMLRTKVSIVPETWSLTKINGHDRQNAALALQTGKLFRVDDDLAREVLVKWKPLKGRLELVKKVRGVEYYNDTASICPRSTEIAIKDSKEKNIILLFGGTRVGHDYKNLYSLLPQYVKMAILLPGSGTIHERQTIANLKDLKTVLVPSIEEAVLLAAENAGKNDKVIFSPGFEANGLDNSRKERGERFVKAVRGL